MNDEFNFRERPPEHLTWDFGYQEGNILAYERAIFHLQRLEGDGIDNLIMFLGAFIAQHKIRLDDLKDKSKSGKPCK